MKSVCQRYGALFILDEVMSGMGRCGTLHAWEQEGVVPDLQTIGKGLGGGYAPVSGVLIGDHIVQTMDKGTGVFRHGQTYQGHPIACAAALAVQSVIQEENLLENVRTMGDYLEKGLKERIGGHPNVGDIRGKGLFWGVRSIYPYAIIKTDNNRSSSSKTKLQKSPSTRRWVSLHRYRKQGCRLDTAFRYMLLEERWMGSEEIMFFWRRLTMCPRKRLTLSLILRRGLSRMFSRDSTRTRELLASSQIMRMFNLNPTKLL